MSRPTFEPPFCGFDGLGGERLYVVRAGCVFEPPLVLLAPERAAALMTEWLADPVQRRALIELHENVFGRSALEPWAHGDIHLPLVHDLRAAFERGDLLLLGVPDAPSPGVASQIDPTRRPSRRPDDRHNRSWVEIELLDENGRRVATELCVTLPDGTKLRPSFSGFLRIDDIDPGMCDIEFPKIHAREWSRSGT